MPHSTSRPGSVIAAAVLLLVYGGLSLLWGVCGSAGLAMRALDIQQVPLNPVPNDWFAIVGLIMYCGIGLPLVIAGIGVLKLNRWARILAYVTIIADVLISCLPFMGVLTAYVGQLGRDNQHSLWLAFTCMALFGVLRLAFDIPILICLRSPATRAAFSAAPSEVPAK